MDWGDGESELRIRFSLTTGNPKHDHGRDDEDHPKQHGLAGLRHSPPQAANRPTISSTPQLALRRGVVS